MPVPRWVLLERRWSVEPFEVEWNGARGVRWVDGDLLGTVETDPGWSSVVISKLSLGVKLQMLNFLNLAVNDDA